jgi:N-acetylmuramoyl-L-alanine amidase
LIDGDAQIYKFVEEDKRAWHAGSAAWGDVTDINSASIGIEIWNTGHEYDFEDFIPAQIDVLIELIKDIRSRWAIPDEYILGHSDVAPGRKLDPGEKFPWKKLAKAGIGLMPSGCDGQIPIDDFFSTLRAYGYTYTDDQSVLLREFRRHFLPHLLSVEGVTDEDAQALFDIFQ